MKIKLNFIPTELLEQYCSQVDENVEQHFQNLNDSKT